MPIRDTQCRVVGDVESTCCHTGARKRLTMWIVLGLFFVHCMYSLERLQRDVLQGSEDTGE